MNSAMGTVVGELIQMNSKMVMSSAAETVIVISTLFFLGFAIATAVAAGTSKWWWVTLILAVISVGAIVYGVKMPRVKEIHACVNGPLSLEQVEAVYDIVKIDGKELTLRVR